MTNSARLPSAQSLRKLHTHLRWWDHRVKHDAERARWDREVTNSSGGTTARPLQATATAAYPGSAALHKLKPRPVESQLTNSLW